MASVRVGEIATGPEGLLFVEDTHAGAIYRVDPAGVLTTFVDDVSP